ncbi:MAG TPA: hypothetical protein PLW72_14625 [Burkholderiaceae bacterium]|nr:hypothetical protein [Burkholderiaceae bacterium]
MRFRPDPLPDMDIVAHSLWAGLGAVAAARRWPVSASQALTAVASAALPDIAHLIPIVGWGLLGDGSWQAIQGYALAKPGAEPWLPAAVQVWSHHLHCVMHSGVVASVATMIAWFRWRWLLVPLAGWWSHIVLDVFTHSSGVLPVTCALSDHPTWIRWHRLDDAVVHGAELRSTGDDRPLAVAFLARRPNALTACGSLFWER